MDLKEQIQNLGKCTDLKSATPYFAALDLSELSLQHFTFLGRKIEGYLDAPDVKIAYLANFTIDPLPTYLNVHAAFRGIKCDSYIGAYNQYFQELLTENGNLTKFAPNIIFLSLSMKLLEPKLFYEFSDLSHDEKEKYLEKITSLFGQFLESAIAKFESDIIITNFPLPPFTNLGIADGKDLLGEIHFYYELNKNLADLAKNKSRVHVLDLAKLSARLGSKNIYDPKMYYVAKILWSDHFFSAVAEEVVRFIIALKGYTKKCCVLDLDNTLWGGIIGEDGPLGVKVGQGDPVSEAFFDFQHKIRALKNRGIMLAICSKNNEGDVLETFEKRPEMPLKLSDFAAKKINWDHKHLNIERLSQELNIGLDSFVFIDDNPVECELVRQMLPQVKTVQLPSSHEKMADLIDSLVEFEKVVVLEDDLKKTEQYHQKRERDGLKNSVGNLTDYLESLETEICIRSAKQPDLERVHQLFTKTNQFNVTTIRYSMGDVEKFYNEGRYDLTVVSAKDRFGDLGIIGQYLLVLDGDQVSIDSFILSCRAMGRGIENAIMNRIKEQYVATDEGRKLVAQYIPTKKNVPVKDFFDEQGFTVIQEMQEGGKEYILPVENCCLTECSWIKINDDGGQ